jgi:hypothetical protein
MQENDINDILQSRNIPEILNKIGKFYTNGFDINEIDIRIKNKIKELEEKFAKYNDTIEDIRKKKYIIIKTIN